MNLVALGIVTKDLQRTVNFYGQLGVELKPHEEGSEHWEGVTHSGLRLMVDTETLMKKINPDWQPTPGGRVSLCFLQASPKDVDQVYKTLTESGAEGVKAPWDAFWGQRYATVKDPDGNPVDLFAELS